MDCPDLDYASLFRALPNPYLVLDRSAEIVEANGAYLAATRRELADVVGRCIWDVCPIDSATFQQAIVLFEAVKRTKKPHTLPLFRFDLPAPEAQGGGLETRYWSITFSPVIDKAGEVQLTLLHCVDVAEQQQLRDSLVTPEPTQTFDPVDGQISNANGAQETRPALDEEAHRLQELFAQAPSFMAIVRGRDHRFEMTNEVYRQLVGRDDLVGLTVREALPELEGQGFFHLLDAVYRTGKPYVGRGVEIAFRPSPEENMELRVVDFVYQPITGPGGEVTGIFVEGIDVTARAASEAALITNEAHSRQILDGAIDYAIVATDLQGHVTRWNEGARRVLGWTEAEMLGDTIARFFTPEDVEAGQVETEMRVSLETERAIDERWHQRKSGERFWAAGETTVLRDAAGEAVGFVKVLRDRTEHRAAEQALRQSEERLRALVSASSEALYSMSSDWSEMRQLSGGGFLADTSTANPTWLDDYIHPDDHAEVRHAIAQAIRTRNVFQLEHRVRQANGSLGWTSSRAVPLLNAAGEVIEWFGAATDVTARRQAEEDLRKLTATLEQRVEQRTAELVAAEDALRQSQKLEAVGQLTGGVAHDFNNLLTIIRSSVDFLKRGDLPAARKERYVEAISETVDRASKLTSQLLAFARRQPLKPEVFDVSARVEAVAELVRPLMGTRISILVEPCERSCHTEADPSQFETALVNLAVNARDAMGGEGSLTFKVRELKEVPAIRGHAGGPGNFIAVSVTDTGTGIDPSAIASIFEPFYTTKEVGKGTGLGLSQVFGFTKQSGGEVGVESQPGRGATFTLYLPHVAPAPIDRASDTAAPAPPPGRGICVLIVEDNHAVGRFANEMLQDLGYHTRLVGSAGEALALLTESTHGFDVIFSDVIMPGMNGVDLGNEIRRRFPTLPVILTSGYSNVLAQDSHHGFELLRKPYSIDELSRVLGRMTQPTS